MFTHTLFDHLEKEKSKLNLKAVIEEDTPQSGICIHTSLEQQVYALISESKNKGILAKVLPSLN
jgi:hypothetical protein